MNGSKKNEKTYDVTVPVTVRITVVDEPIGALSEEMHPLDPRRMEGIYDLEDPAEMLQHLAYNAARNNQTHAASLDGWGDIPAEFPDGAEEWPRWKRQMHLDDHYPVRMEIIEVDSRSADHLDTPPTTEEVQSLEGAQP